MNYFKRSLMYVGVLAVIGLAGSPAMAGTRSVNNNQMIGMFQADQREAVEGSLKKWCDGADSRELVNDIQRLVEAESGLIAYGFNMNDKRLFSRLAKDMNMDIPKFVARLFFERMAQEGFKPGPAQATFAARRFDVSRRSGGDSERIDF